MPEGKQSVVVLSDDDNVATTLREIRAGEDVEITRGGAKTMVRAQSDIPFLHKIALSVIKKGDLVIKYGYPIGEATADIAPGDHVHTHNLRSRRGRADN